MNGRVVHFEIPFDDGDRARSFYAEAFGWELSAAPEVDYTIASTGPSGSSAGPPTEPGYINGGLSSRGPGLTGPTVVIDVEDIDATLAVVERLGGSTVLGRTPVGAMGFSAYFTDSEGNVIGLWQSV
ncbi:VOC family protein [Nocardioides mesophilus]|uniref:VOC family protein n=1 Tax=Nocardioides mesophilus TaxID=433659 RepID=A0A7G9RFG7_9ACTN|nr:VOC family protein [Nocardioides mesophilus]QNN54342.1 VOC family protein [Nocardioides mesophilus]